jgi:exonuclease SbcC
MRPSKLIITNIASFAGRVELDFSELGEFFLVCGPTGSGKTTIFESMAYALYGELPGTRQAADLVSHFAGEADEAGVEFEFELGARGARYRVERRPARLVPKKRGEGFTERPAEAALFIWEPGGASAANRTKQGGASPAGASPAAAARGGELDFGHHDALPTAVTPPPPGLALAGRWQPLTERVPEVAQRVQGLLGLSAEEFSKIVLLPQGQFQRFLEMNSKERAEILEKLFPVAIYGKVAEAARGRAQEAKARLKSLDERALELTGRLGGDGAELVAGLAERAARAREEEAAARVALDRALGAAERARAAMRPWAERREARAALDGYEAAENETKAMRVRLAAAEAAAGARAELAAWDRAAELEREEEARLAAATEELQGLRAREPERRAADAELDALAAAASEAERELGDLKAKSAAWERLTLAEATLARATADHEAAAARADAAARDLAAAGERLTELGAGLPDSSALRAARLAAQAAAQEAQAAASAAERRLRAAEAYAAAVKTRAELEVESARLEAEAVAARGQLQALRALVAADEAGKLSALLRDGEPCPVCGSLEHPAPAQGLAGRKDGAAASESTAGVAPGGIAAAERALSVAERAAAAAAARAQAAAERVDELHAELTGGEAGGAEAGEAREPLDAVAAETAFIDASERAALSALALAEAEAAEEAAAAQLAALEAARAELESARAARDEAAAAASIALSDLAAARSTRDEALAAAGSSDPRPRASELEASLAASRARLAALKAESEAFRAGLARAESAQAAAEAGLARARDALATSRSAAQAALESAGFADREAWAAAAMDAAALAALRRELEARERGRAAALARLAAAQAAWDAIAATGGYPCAADGSPDLASAEADARATDARWKELRQAADEATAAEREARALGDELASLKARRAALGAESEGLASLSSLLNGETGRRITFKNYALARYFAEVAANASIRLREMSDGRYELRLASGRARGVSRSGLDLEVADSYTGRARPTDSLSGGEKFLCSVSLALGLSDVIVRGAGGTALDAVFIDEGFGSLDDESLDRALAALDRMRGERVIGIVSHVAELRERIASRVEVTKTRFGSTITVV